MSYYLDLFTPSTWSGFRDHGGTVSGFTEGMKRRAERIVAGDIFICYLVRLSRWCGALEVEKGPYIDKTPIFSQLSDKFVTRFQVKPLVLLDPADAIPVSELWDQLLRTRNVDRKNRGWSYSAQLVASLSPIDPADGKLIRERLQQQSKEHKPYPLDAASKRLLLERPVTTPRGTVEVVVPDKSEDAVEEDTTSAAAQAPIAGARDSIVIQSTLASIGAKMGYSVWVPRSDRIAVQSRMATGDAKQLLDSLPLNYEDNTLRTVEQIDVIWLRARSIVRAFEVEHTTAVYSGLLRMADLLSLQPNIDIRLHIVADESKRDKVFREIKRPVFSLLENGALSESCSYLSYTSVKEISKLPHLSRMTDAIIDDFQEIVE